ncbi:MAG: hypothetical protein ACTS41_01470 [Candidatus Hodgkinia cicadicola]
MCGGPSDGGEFVRVLGGDSAVVLRFGGGVNVSEVRRGNGTPTAAQTDWSCLLEGDLAKHKCGLSSQVGV